MSTNPQTLNPLTKISETETTPDKPQPVQWLLPGVIPLSAVSCIISKPGCGKSPLIHWLAAKVSAKESMLFRGEPIPQGIALFVGCQIDSPEKIRSNLVENGANTANVLRIESDNLKQVFEALPALPSCRLVVIDPFSYFSLAEPDRASHTVQNIITKITEFARKSNTAIVFVIDLPKFAETYNLAVLSKFVW